MSSREGRCEPTVAKFSQVSTGSLKEDVSRSLRTAIWHGEVTPGERLNERLIAEELGVSRPPLREAIRELEMEGLVETWPRRGSYVRRLSGDDVRELYIVRCALEQAAAEILAARTVDPADGVGIETELEELERHTVHSLQSTIEADLRFHHSMVRLSGVHRLVAAWERLAGELRLALRLVDPEYFGRTYVERTHRPLLTAIGANDRDEIRKCIDEFRDVGESLGDAWAELSGVTDETSLPAGTHDEVTRST